MFKSKPIDESAAAPASDSTAPAVTAAAPAYTIRDAAEVVSAGTAPPSAPGAVKRGFYKMRGIPGHTKKLNALARQAAGKSVNEALAQMAFSPSRRARWLSQAITRACLNADTFHALPRDSLLVEEVLTGKHQTSGRIRHHSKGRAGRSHWRTARLLVRVRQMRADERETRDKFAVAPATNARASSGMRAALDPRGY